VVDPDDAVEWLAASSTSEALEHATKAKPIASPAANHILLSLLTTPHPNSVGHRDLRTRPSVLTGRVA
jgi:hypothetical protein